jgi:hypothetical protein
MDEYQTRQFWYGTPTTEILRNLKPKSAETIILLAEALGMDVTKMKEEYNKEQSFSHELNKTLQERGITTN